MWDGINELQAPGAAKEKKAECILHQESAVIRSREVRNDTHIDATRVRLQPSLGKDGDNRGVIRVMRPDGPGPGLSPG